jgi:hypothetical protein
MTQRHLRLFGVLAASVMLAAACSSSDAAVETTTTTATSPPTTTTPPETTTTTLGTTTTTEPGVEVFDSINGLPGDEALIDRRVVGIKIDNHPKARPQSALQSADAVYEILVEGGLTRFIALFHQTDLDWVGPNRSGRPTDSKVMAALEGGPFQISGAQGWVKNIFRADGINVVFDNGVTTYRVPLRPGPHNLFTSSILIREWADTKGWPDENPGNLFSYGTPTPGSSTATKVEVSFSGAPASTWEWDGEQYLRFHGSTPHEWVDDDGEIGQVSYDTLVVMRMRKYIARNPAGSGTSLPTVETVGEGDAVVFYNGEVIEGTWEREEITDKFLLTTPDGEEIVLPPGRVWISLQPDSEPLDWE